MSLHDDIIRNIKCIILYRIYVTTQQIVANKVDTAEKLKQSVVTNV